MDPPFFHLASSGDASRLAPCISGSLLLMLATASELTMADPPSAQSDEMDAVSINRERADALAFPMVQRHGAPFTAKVRLSRCRAATNAPYSPFAFQSEPAARSARQTSRSSGATGGCPLWKSPK
jgi:hypothetical protein